MTDDEAIGQALGEIIGPTFSHDVRKLKAKLCELGFWVAPMEPTKEMRGAGAGPWATNDPRAEAHTVYRKMRDTFLFRR